MIGVFIVPTGIGAEIGGHAGDATPAAKLIAKCCNNLIVHPNVINASDINEMSENMLYVEGSMLDRFLEGNVNLKPVKSNRILVVANGPVKNETINAVSSARVTLGINVDILELKTPLKMKAVVRDGLAAGLIEGVSELVDQLQEYNFDALAIHTPIEVERSVALNYFKNGGTNPWGGVEAMLSKEISNRLEKPVAHAPTESMSIEDQQLVLKSKVDPRQAPEVISGCYLQCALKGLQRAPRLASNGISLSSGLSVQDIDFMVSPADCFGPPHKACYSKNIPVIIVEENKTNARATIPNNFIVVKNYWEATGIVMSIKTGIDPWSVRRPLNNTILI